MKMKRSWSERTRLILTLELAVVLPAAALVVLSAVHLNKFQRDRAVEAAIQRDFAQVLAISEKQINQKAYDLMDDVRNDFPSSTNACESTLDRVLVSHPYAAHVFIFGQERGLIFRSQPHRLESAEFRDEADDLEKIVNNWTKMEYGPMVERLTKWQQKGMPYYFIPNYAPRGDKQMMYQTVGLFLVPDPKNGRSEIAGMAFDAEYLRDQFFPQMLNTVISRTQAEEGGDTHAVMMVHTKMDSDPLATSKGWDGGTPEVERNMESVFPILVLSIKMQGTTLAAMGQRFVRTSFFMLGGLSLLLAGGIVLTHRNVSKEMALARLKSDFVSNVSHELRTPLSLIRLYAETLEMGRLTTPEKYHEYYRIIRKESERLTSLINNILDFSRIEAGRKEYDFRETDIGELVRATLDSYRYQIEQHGFTFEEHIAENLPPMQVDREAIARSLVNLVNNALKYSPGEKYLAVNLFQQNGSVKLEVIDRGIGIAREEQGKIFEKFYRVGDPLVHTTKGSGLGLSLVRHIVQAHGGDVKVNSVPGEGSKFIIELPVEAANSSSALHTAHPVGA